MYIILFILSFLWTVGDNSKGILDKIITDLGINSNQAFECWNSFHMIFRRPDETFKIQLHWEKSGGPRPFPTVGIFEINF